MTKQLNEQELNWIEHLIGKIYESELLPENRVRLAARRRRIAEIRAQGLVPVRDIDGGIVI